MRAYSVASEEALLARNLLKDWTGEGFLTEAQYQRMEQDTVCELRRSNIFLRVVLFLFTMLIVGAAVGLFFVVFLSHADSQTTGIFLLIFAAVLYAGAEFAVLQAHLYRHGIEEALAVCSVGFLCAGMQIAFFNGRIYSPHPNGMEFLVPVAGALASLWIWHRFGLAYAFPAAMVFVLFLPGYWTRSHSAQRLIVAAFYAAGLMAVTSLRARDSIAEAFLWLGIYLAINLQLSSLNQFGRWWGGALTTGEYSRTFYWATWALIWCLPAAVLWRGLRRKDRFVMGVGAITAILTLITNKPYLGWQRHSWDPMLLGALLVGVVLFIRRRLTDGPDGIREGFTAQRLSGKDKRWMDAVSMASSVVSQQATTLRPQPGSADIRFGGGESGGGGASSDF